MDTKKVAVKLRPLIAKNMINILEEKKQTIIDIIMKDYDLMLNGVDTNRDSQSKPEFYEDKFRDLLENLDDDFWINVSDNSGSTEIKFKIPSVISLDLSELPILLFIFEGLSGMYVTATGRQFKEAKMKIGSRVPLDENVRKDDMVYLIRFTHPLRKKMEIALNLKKGLPLYAFSNSPGIDIFENAKIYFSDNLKKWKHKAGVMATNELKGIYK